MREQLARAATASTEALLREVQPDKAEKDSPDNEPAAEGSAAKDDREQQLAERIAEADRRTRNLKDDAPLGGWFATSPAGTLTDRWSGRNGPDAAA